MCKERRELLHHTAPPLMPCHVIDAAQHPSPTAAAAAHHSPPRAPNICRAPAARENGALEAARFFRVSIVPRVDARRAAGPLAVTTPALTVGDGSSAYPVPHGRRHVRCSRSTLRPYPTRARGYSGSPGVRQHCSRWAASLFDVLRSRAPAPTATASPSQAPYALPSQAPSALPAVASRGVPLCESSDRAAQVRAAAMVVSPSRHATLTTAERRTERKGVALQLIRSVEQRGYMRDGAEEDRIESELRRERSKSSPLAGAKVRLHVTHPVPDTPHALGADISSATLRRAVVQPATCWAWGRLGLTHHYLTSTRSLVATGG